MPTVATNSQAVNVWGSRRPSSAIAKGKSIAAPIHNPKKEVTAGSRFLQSIFPKMYHEEYANPELKANQSPICVLDAKSGPLLPRPRIRNAPSIDRIIAAILAGVMRSLRKNHESTATKAGAVYNKAAACCTVV